MHFSYFRKSEEDLREAKKSHIYEASSQSDESLLARYHLLSYFSRTYGYIPNLLKSKEGAPLPISGKNGEIYYWSLSHSKNFIAFMVAENPCGIDIAEYEERDESLLNTHNGGEYSLLGGKNWRNFYILWTAKEALIKMIGGSLDDIHNIHYSHETEDGRFFVFGEESYKIETVTENNLFISTISLYDTI